MDRNELTRQKERTLRAAWMISLMAPLATAAAFLLGRSTTQMADFLRRTIELLALFSAWLTVRKVSTGPTDRYNYGYGKLEHLSSLGVALVMAFSSAVIAYSAVARLLRPVPLGWVLPGILIPVGGVVVNGWFWRRGHRLALLESTPVIESQWRLYRAKTILDICVIITLGLTVLLQAYPWSSYIDPIGSMFIAAFLVVTAYRMAQRSVIDLLDRAPDRETVLSIQETVRGHFDILSMRSRFSGGRLLVELVVQCPPGMTVDEFRRKASEVTRSLRECMPHVDPSITPAPPEGEGQPHA